MAEKLPGMTKDDIEVDISDAHLILKGQTKKEELLRPDDVRRGLEENGARDGKKID